MDCSAVTARPGWFLEIRRPQLVRVRARRLILATRDVEVDHGIGQAPVTGPVKPSAEAELEHGPGLRAADDELSLHGRRHRQIPLAAEQHRLERDFLIVPVLIPRPQPDRTHAEARHASQSSVRVSP